MQNRARGSPNGGLNQVDYFSVTPNNQGAGAERGRSEMSDDKRGRSTNHNPQGNANNCAGRSIG